MITVARPADTVAGRRSRPDTWASSCPSTPRSSASSSEVSRPSVQQMAALRGLRPTANEFGCSAGDRKSRGTGSPAALAQLPHQAVELGMLDLAHRPGRHRGQGQPVAVGARHGQDDGGDRESGDRAGAARDCGADPAAQGDQRQHGGHEPGGRAGPAGTQPRAPPVSAHDHAPPGIPRSASSRMMTPSPGRAARHVIHKPGRGLLPESVTNYIGPARSSRAWEYQRADERWRACSGVRFVPS